MTWRVPGWNTAIVELEAWIPPPLTAMLLTNWHIPLISRRLCLREIPPPLLFAILLAIVVSPYIVIVLSVANSAPPSLARLFEKCTTLSLVKFTVDWKLVIAPPSWLVDPFPAMTGSMEFSNVKWPLKVRLLLNVYSDPIFSLNLLLVTCVEHWSIKIIPLLLDTDVKRLLLLLDWKQHSS